MNRKQIESMELPTAFGRFQLWVWNGERGRETVALSTPQFDPAKEVMVRIHSECLTGDVFHSLTCDCGPQKELALKKIYEHGNGIFIYHRQEGRNEGLFKKIQGYNLMQSGLDTHEAYIKLVGHPDAREYSDVLIVLEELLGGRKSNIRLLTNNPYKVLFLERHGYSVGAEPLRAGANVHNTSYTESKTQKFLHDTVGSEPYVGITTFREDIKQSGAEIKSLLKSFEFSEMNRRVFLGVTIFPEKGDLDDAMLVKELNVFQKNISQLKHLHIVFHMDYPARRREHRMLSRFLDRLEFSYSLQFRLKNAFTKVDIDLIHSFHGEHVIFQIKEEHLFLLDQKNFSEYFSSANKFLLLDESWGSGTDEDISKRKEKILKLVSRGLSRVAVAGGFNAENASRVYALEDHFKIPISVDAESKLRTDGDFDVSKAKTYLAHFFPQHV